MRMMEVRARAKTRLEGEDLGWSGEEVIGKGRSLLVRGMPAAEAPTSAGSRCHVDGFRWRHREALLLAYSKADVARESSDRPLLVPVHL